MGDLSKLLTPEISEQVKTHTLEGDEYVQCEYHPYCTDELKLMVIEVVTCLLECCLTEE